MADAKHKVGTANKQTLKMVLWILLAAGILIFIVLTVKKFHSEQEKSDELEKQRDIAQQAAEEAENIEKRYGKPVSTTADTDTVRRYGYDVLYAHHGLRILLTESKVYTEVPEIKFNMINDGDEALTVSLNYGVVNGLTFYPKFEATVEPGKEQEQTLKFDYTKMSEIQVSKIRLCFDVSNSDYSIRELSEPILIEYDKAPNDSWNAPTDCENVYDIDVFRLDAKPFRTEENSTRNTYYSNIYCKNETMGDLELYLDDYKLYDKNGKEIDESKHNASFYAHVPGYALTSYYLKIKVDKSINKEDLGEITVQATMTPRTTNDFETDSRTISFTVPIKYAD